MRYADGAAFRRALADRLRRVHADQDPGRLLKRVAMERFLARVAATLPDQARLKGGYALELRLVRARATQDIDLALRRVAADDVLEALRDAADADLGDHFRFRVDLTTRGVPQGAPYGGKRLTVVPELGGQRFVPFPLDVGVGDVDVATPDILRGGIDLSFAGLPPLDVPAVPVELHLAEKLHALSVPRADGRENSRVKDLIDVVLIRRVALSDVPSLRRAVVATFDRRGTHALPTRIDVPASSWRSEYARLAADLDLEEAARDLDGGVAILDELLDVVHGEEER